MKTLTGSLVLRRRSSLFAVWSLVSLATALRLAPTARAVSEPSAITGERRSFALSWEDEVKQGAEADKEIVTQMGLYDDPQVQAYVESVGQRVLAASTFNRSDTPEMYRETKFTFRVLDSPVVNAFALPGGYVYVTRGLLAHADNEAQLAVVLGHEIAHVAARHASLQARRSQWGQIGMIAGAILGQAVLGERMPNFAQNVLQSGGQALQVFMLRYSREAEHEADTLGMDYALTAGYAAGEAARFFDTLRRISEREGKGLPTWMSSHPDPGNRADRVVGMARERPAGPAERIVAQDRYLQAIEGLIVGEDPRQGFVQNNVFYHPVLRFQMPVAPNWQVENQPTALIFAEPNGRAMMGLRLATASRTRDAAAQFVSENKVQVTASGDTAVNGLPTSVVVGRVATEQGQLGVWNALIEYEGKVYSVLGYAPAQVFDQVRGTFESVAGGFSPLRDAQMANVQPARLRVVRAEQRAPFASYVPASLPPTVSAEEVAIMNQISLETNVPAGAALKVPDASVTPAARPPIVAEDAAPPVQPVPQNRYPPSTYPPPSYPQQGYPPVGQQNPPPSTPNGYPYPNQGGSNPTGAGTYPNRDGAYPGSGGYPPHGGTYPAPGGAYPGQPYPNQSGSAGYPPAYPPQPGYPSSYPPTSAPSYPPSQSSNPPAGYPSSPGYPPQHPTSQYPGAYPSGGYPSQPQPGTGATTTTTSAPNWPR